MRKLALMILLAVVSSNAMAEWVKVGHNEGITIYTDPSTISRADDLVKLWKLVDYQKAPAQNFTKPFKSFKVHIEFDCKEGNSRRVAQTFYSDNMGEGDAVLAENIDEHWTLHNLADTLWKIACEKK